MKLCAHCEQPLRPDADPRAIFCSTPCRKAAHLAKQAEIVDAASSALAMSRQIIDALMARVNELEKGAAR